MPGLSGLVQYTWSGGGDRERNCNHPLCYLFSANNLSKYVHAMTKQVNTPLGGGSKNCKKTESGFEEDLYVDLSSIPERT